MVYTEQISRAEKLTDQLLRLADEITMASDDDSALLLASLLRDGALGIRRGVEGLPEIRQRFRTNSTTSTTSKVGRRAPRSAEEESND